MFIPAGMINFYKFQKKKLTIFENVNVFSDLWFSSRLLWTDFLFFFLNAIYIITFFPKIGCLNFWFKHEFLYLINFCSI